MLHLAKLQVSRGDFSAALSHLSISPGQCVALCGVSGSGKSTLLEAIGLLTPNFTAANFSFAGFDINSLSSGQQQIIRVSKMGIMPQVGGLLPFLSVAENWKTQIALAKKQNLSHLPEPKTNKAGTAKAGTEAGNAKASTATSASNIETNTIGAKAIGTNSQATDSKAALSKLVAPQNNLALLSEKELFQRLLPLAERLGLKDHINKLPEQLSIGQRQRALFLRAIAHAPQLLLIDEPTSSLDPDNALVLFKVIEEIAHDSHMGVLVVTHDLDLVADYTQYVYQPDRSHGGFAFFGPKGE